MTSISSPLNPGQDCSLGYSLPIISQAQGSHAVNEECGEVEVPAVLAGGVVIGKGVVVVVEALTCKESKESRHGALLIAIFLSLSTSFLAVFPKPERNLLL